MSKTIPLSVPVIKGNEWTYIKECLETGWVSSAGKYVEQFERKICEYTNANYSVAMVNGTSALQMALTVVGVEAGDEVIVPTVTFIAPVNVVSYLDAHPIFMDSDEYYNIDVKKTVQFLEDETYFRNGFSYNKKTKRRISAVVPVHIFGNAVNLDDLMPICRKRNIRVVEDSTESLGTQYCAGKFAGKQTGTIGDVGCFSFNGNKIITTGGGGMMVTNAKKFADRARYLSTQAKDDPVRYVHHEIGYNFRLTNIQSALGVAQLEKLDEYIQTKIRNLKIYAKEVAEIEGLRMSDAPKYASCNHWMYPIRIQAKRYGKTREQLMNYLSENGIQSRPLWKPNHQQKPYRHCQTYQIDLAPRLHAETLTMPCSVNLTKRDIRKVTSTLAHG